MTLAAKDSSSQAQLLTLVPFIEAFDGVSYICSLDYRLMMLPANSAIKLYKRSAPGALMLILP